MCPVSKLAQISNFRSYDFLILVQESLREISNTAKCSQWPHLYKSYEATYILKCFIFEKIAKNTDFHLSRVKKSVFRDFLNK